jgi:hypothetical protein
VPSLDSDNLLYTRSTVVNAYVDDTGWQIVKRRRELGSLPRFPSARIYTTPSCGDRLRKPPTRSAPGFPFNQQKTMILTRQQSHQPFSRPCGNHSRTRSAGATPAANNAYSPDFVMRGFTAGVTVLTALRWRHRAGRHLSTVDHVEFYKGPSAMLFGNARGLWRRRQLHLQCSGRGGFRARRHPSRPDFRDQLKGLQDHRATLRKRRFHFSPALSSVLKTHLL